MISVLYDDQDLLAVDKPEGLAVIPERDPTRPSLVAILARHMGIRPYVVHRIDKQVSGVVLIAKNAQTHRYLNQLFEQRKVSKSYLALVHGVVQKDSGTVERPLRDFGSGRTGVDEMAGRPAITEFQVLMRYHDFTLLRACPITGRRHQIRAHLYCIGHPVVGDQMYGRRSQQARFPRLMLHSHRIQFANPVGRDISIQSPPPSSFQAVLASIQKPDSERQ